MELHRNGPGGLLGGAADDPGNGSIWAMNAAPGHPEGYPWSSAVMTHIGKVRDLNEDAVLSRPDFGLWAVADGMGGHEGGDRASRMVVDALSSLQRPDGLEDLLEAAKRQLQSANRRLHEDALSAMGNISGSTVAVLLVHGRQGAALWAGDSRIYLYRNNSLQALSRDHSRLEEWVAQGLLERDQAAGHPAANLITRAVGVTDTVELDTVAFEVLPGDMFLLCSDGLYNEVDEERMSRALGGGDCQRAAEQLVALALAGAARDNISLVVTRAGPLQTVASRG